VEFGKIHIDILYKLWRNKCFGKGHMLIDNVLRGFPKDKKDKFGEAVDGLIKTGYLIQKTTKHGYAVYIDPKLRVEIRKILEKHYDFL